MEKSNQETACFEIDLHICEEFGNLIPEALQIAIHYLERIAL